MDTTDLTRIEAAERAALRDLHRCASSDLSRQLGLEEFEISSALVSIAGSAPSILVNRVIGLGLGEPAGREPIERILGHYDEAGVDRFFVHVDPLGPWHAQVEAGLRSSGLVPYHRAWAKFVRGAAAISPRESDLDVRPAAPGDANHFGRIAAAGFELDDRWIPVLASLVGQPDWHVYLSYAGSTPVGCGALRIHEDVAWLDWGATLPDYRGRGSQGIVLARRINEATAMGCKWLATCTGEAVPGDPQHSYRNILRAGFSLSHLRQNWVPGQASVSATSAARPRT